MAPTLQSWGKLDISPTSSRHKPVSQHLLNHLKNFQSRSNFSINLAVMDGWQKETAIINSAKHNCWEQEIAFWGMAIENVSVARSICIFLDDLYYSYFRSTFFICAGQLLFNFIYFINASTNSNPAYISGTSTSFVAHMSRTRMIENANFHFCLLRYDTF